AGSGGSTRSAPCWRPSSRSGGRAPIGDHLLRARGGAAPGARQCQVVRAAAGRGAGAPPCEASLGRVVRAATGRGAGAPPCEASLGRVVRAATGRGAGAPPCEASL